MKKSITFFLILGMTWVMSVGFTQPFMSARIGCPGVSVDDGLTKMRQTVDEVTISEILVGGYTRFKAVDPAIGSRVDNSITLEIFSSYSHPAAEVIIVFGNLKILSVASQFPWETAVIDGANNNEVTLFVSDVTLTSGGNYFTLYGIDAAGNEKVIEVTLVSWMVD